MMNIEMQIEKLQEVVDNAFTLPLSGGKTVVDAEALRKIIDDMRNNLPQEIRQAKGVVADRDNVIAKAKEESEKIVQQAEERAKSLVSQSEIVRQAQKQADEIIFNANKKAGEIKKEADNAVADANKKAEGIKKAADSYIDSLMSNAEKGLSDTLSDLKTKRQALKAVRQKKIPESDKKPDLSEDNK